MIQQLLLLLVVEVLSDEHYQLIHEYNSFGYVYARQPFTYYPQLKEQRKVIALIKFIFSEREGSSQQYGYFSSPVCAVLPKRQINFLDLEITKDKRKIQTYEIPPGTIQFDYQASMTNSDIHLVQLQWWTNETLYIAAGDLLNINSKFKLQYQIFIKNISTSIACINDCQSLNIARYESAFKKCINATCHCSMQYFGSYCQFQKSPIKLGYQLTVLLQQQQWIYFSFSIQDDHQQRILLSVANLQHDILISFAFNGLKGYEIPSLQQSEYNIPANLIETSYTINQYFEKYLELSNQIKIESKEIIIGILNPSRYPLQFEIKFYDPSSDTFLEFVKENCVLLSFLLANLFISIIFLCYSRVRAARLRQQMQNNSVNLTQVQRQIRRRKVRGFRKEFLEIFFPPYDLNDLLSSYPALNEQIECVICLEPMKKEITEESLVFCTLTPCFHLYHHDCIIKWLSVEKYCPICREAFTENQIRVKKKWINLNNSVCSARTNKETERNQYIKRIKKSKIENSYDSRQHMLDNTIQDPNSISFNLDRSSTDAVNDSVIKQADQHYPDSK